MGTGCPLQHVLYEAAQPYTAIINLYRHPRNTLGSELPGKSCRRNKAFRNKSSTRMAELLGDRLAPSHDRRGNLTRKRVEQPIPDKIGPKQTDRMAEAQGSHLPTQGEQIKTPTQVCKLRAAAEKP